MDEDIEPKRELPNFNNNFINNNEDNEKDNTD